jgi:hypothetical protein
MKYVRYLLVVFAVFWLVLLALRIGAEIVAPFLHGYPPWWLWVHRIPTIPTEGPNPQWYNYWPLFLLMATALMARLMKALENRSRRRAELR